jgi:protein TonB
MHVLPDDNRPVPVAPRPLLCIVLPVLLAHVVVIGGLVAWVAVPGKGGMETVRVALVAMDPVAAEPAATHADATPPHPRRHGVPATPVSPAPAIVQAPPVAAVAAAVSVPAAAPAAPAPVAAATATVAAAAGATSASPATAGVLQSAPGFLVQPPPPYPEDLRLQGIEGSVVLRVHVDAEGWPQRVSIDRSSGYAQFDHSAVATVQQHYRFRPAQEGGRSVAADVRFAVPFRLSD